MINVSKSSIVAAVILCGVCIMVIATAIQQRVDPMRLYYDIQTIGQVSEQCCSAYDGAISTLGIMLWTATSAVALFCALFFYVIASRAELNFALHVGFLSAWLAMDDAYLLHEVVLPRLGVPQLWVLGGIGIALIALLVIHRSILERKMWWVLVVSISLFAVSASVDTILPGVGATWLVVEDGSKFIGIVAWCLFFVDAFSKLLLSRLALPEFAPGGDHSAKSFSSNSR